MLGALASGILLYGISLLYGFTGTMSFTGIAAAFAREATPSIGLLFGLVFLLAGIAFKISAVPFHMWTPDVYEGAPTPVTAFFASAPKVAAVLLATRVCLDALGPAIDAWRQIVIFAALASIILGAVAAYGQTNIKRLLAYSSINNVGFALIGLAAGGPKGASSVLFYMAVYVVMTLGAFLCVLRMRDEGRRADRKPGQPVRPVADAARLWPRRSPSSCSASPGSRPCSASGPSCWCSMPRSTQGLCALAVAGIVGTVVGAYYYLQDRQDHVFRRRPSPPCAKARAPVETCADPARRAGRLAARLSPHRPARGTAPTAPRESIF